MPWEVCQSMVLIILNSKYYSSHSSPSHARNARVVAKWYLALFLSIPIPMPNPIPDPKLPINDFSFPVSSPHLVPVESRARALHTAVVLHSPSLHGVPHLLIVPWLSLLHNFPLSLEARLWCWCGGASSGRCGRRTEAGGVVDGEGIVHLAVVLLQGFPGLGDVAVLGGGGV